MPSRERTVLHVLPHPGGGGERYVDLLGEMPGYRFDRAHLGSSASPSPGELTRGMARVLRKARGYDLLHVHGEVAAGLCLPLLATRPSVVTLHGLHLVRRLKGFRRRAAVLSLRAVLRAAGETICVSETEHDELARLVGANPGRRATVVRNGVRLPGPGGAAERAAVRGELAISETSPLAIWVGSLDGRKDPLAAIHAAHRARVRLLVVGDGPLRPEVERASQGRAHVLGRRPDVTRLLSAADMFVLTSHREGLALSLLEAMAHGLPAVVTDLPENREAIGDAGLAVRLGDEDALTDALVRLAAREDERRVLGERARHRIADLFDADEMISRTRSVYDRTLPMRAKPERGAPAG